MERWPRLLIFFLIMGAPCVHAMEETVSSISNSKEYDDLIRDLLSDHTVSQVKPDRAVPKTSPTAQDAPGERFMTMSIFKQQLSYHDRLTVDTIKKTVVIDEELIPSRMYALDYLAKQLLAVAGKKSAGAQLSGWVFKLDNNSYILHPLHLAIKHNLHDCVKTLLAEGASPNATDHLGRKPLHLLVTLADEDEQVKLAKRLFFYNAVIDAPNNQGNSPLTCAAQEGADLLVDFLLDNGVNPNIHVEAETLGQRSAYACGMSPLWAAASHNRRAAVALLLKKNARLKASEQGAAQLMHDISGDQDFRILLNKVLATP